MGARELTLEDLLERVDLKNNDLDGAIKRVLENYELGEYISHEPLLVGHEELNDIITTTNGVYVIKFINKRKERDIAAGLVNAMVEFDKGGVPVPKLVENNAGTFLSELSADVGKGYLFISNYFEGHTFNEVKATNEDVKNIARYMAKMHNLNFETKPEIDPWIPYYLANEFNRCKEYLSEEDLSQVSKAVDIFKSLDLSACSKGVGHFDAHRDNIKKNDKGEICFFDLATVDKNYTIFDLGAFIGFFLDKNQSIQENKKRYDAILDAYSESRTLNGYEKAHVFDCMKIIYASNVLLSNYLREAEGNDTGENQKWYDLGKWGLDTFLDMSYDEWMSV